MKVVLAEPHVLIREGLVSLFAQHDIQVAATPTSKDALVRAAADPGVELVVTEVRFVAEDGTPGLDAVRVIRSADPGAPVLVLSQYAEVGRLRPVVNETGTAALGYVLKSRVQSAQELVRHVHAVAHGGTVLDPLILSRLVGSDPGGIDTLSTRELEVLRYLAQGRSNLGIAHELHVSQAAVAKHVGNILMKLHIFPDDGCHRRVSAALAYVKMHPVAVHQDRFVSS